MPPILSTRMRAVGFLPDIARSLLSVLLLRRLFTVVAHGISALPPGTDVGVAAAVQGVVACSPTQPIGAGPAAQEVVSRPPAQVVIPSTATNEIVASQPVD